MLGTGTGTHTGHCEKRVEVSHSWIAIYINKGHIEDILLAGYHPCNTTVSSTLRHK